MSGSQNTKKLLGKAKITTPRLGPCYHNLKIIEYVNQGNNTLVYQDPDSMKEAKERMTSASDYLLKFSLFEGIVADQMLHRLSIEKKWSSSLEILQGFEARTFEKISINECIVAEGERELIEIDSMKEQNITREMNDRVLENLIINIHNRIQSIAHLNATKEYEILKTIKICEANGKIIAGKKNIECLKEQLSLVKSEISNSIESSLNNFKNELDSLITIKENLRSMGNSLENLRDSHLNTLQESILKLIPCFEHFIWADCLNNDLTSKLDASEKIIENNINIEEAKKSLSICETAEPFLQAMLNYINDEILKIDSSYRAFAAIDRTNHHDTVLVAMNKNMITIQQDIANLKVKSELTLEKSYDGKFLTNVELSGRIKPKISFSPLEIIDPNAAPLSGQTLELKNQLDSLKVYKTSLEDQIAKKVFYKNQLRDLMAKEEEIKKKREASSNALREKNEGIKKNYQILLNKVSIQELNFRSEVMSSLVIIFLKNFSVRSKPGICSRSGSLCESTDISANEFYKEIIKSKQIKVKICGDYLKPVHQCSSFSIEDVKKLIFQSKVLMGLKDSSRRVQETERPNESYVDSMFYCLRDSIKLLVLQQQIDLNIDSNAAINQIRIWEKEGIDLMRRLRYEKIASLMDKEKFPLK
ncbi:hypothetical protein SteCoe_30766 [Stentor coeruleus]|uniref:Uncharacterized protein n=1 Tax=Stentor coeruleus TaxID=5963 RepID=A0A1R2B354_9CILI|nr:hypothetical protein SteCoe_30766 [Stentor coeruleus]